MNVLVVAKLTFALLPTMLERRWGRVVNVSSAVVAHPENMIGGNAYATGKAAVEAHTVNLAAELAGSGVTVNAYRPGSVDTAMQAYVRGQHPSEIGIALHDRFSRSYEQGTLITPERSALSLVSRLHGEATGEIWECPRIALTSDPNPIDDPTRYETVRKSSDDAAAPRRPVPLSHGDVARRRQPPPASTRSAATSPSSCSTAGSWCPYCNAQLRAFQRSQDPRRRARRQVVALSVRTRRPAKAADREART